MNADAPLLLDSITDTGASSAGRIVVCGSHGGLYVGYLAAKADLRAVVLNDAGGGLEDAGVAGVHALARAGIAAVAVAAMSARIGDAADMVARGRISTVNSLAKQLGLQVGMDCETGVGMLDSAGHKDGQGNAGQANLAGSLEIAESRQIIPVDGLVDGAVLVDSASLVRPEDAGRVVITGSHGGLVGGDPARALKAPAALGVFNDAGVGIDGAGLTRLPALDEAGVPGLTVSHLSARIGDAVSALETGVISHTNDVAGALGAQPGTRLKAFLASGLVRER